MPPTDVSASAARSASSSSRRPASRSRTGKCAGSPKASLAMPTRKGRAGFAGAAAKPSLAMPTRKGRAGFAGAAAKPSLAMPTRKGRGGFAGAAAKPSLAMPTRKGRGGFAGAAAKASPAMPTRLAARGHVVRALRFLQHRLRRCEPGDGHAVRRAADVVEAEPVAELDRLRVAAVLAADAELDRRLHLAPALDGDAHQLTDAFLVERLEWVALDDAFLEIEREELALGVVARHAESRLRQVVRPEREEVRVLGDPVCA